MATTGEVNGTLIKIKIGGSNAAYLTSNDESFKNDLRETTNKDSGGYATYAGGKKGGTYSFELLMVEGSTNGYSTLFGLWANATVNAIEVSSGVAGDKKYSSYAIISDLKRSNPLEANSTVTGTLTITGPITEATV